MVPADSASSENLQWTRFLFSHMAGELQEGPCLRSLLTDTRGSGHQWRPPVLTIPHSLDSTPLPGMDNMREWRQLWQTGMPENIHGAPPQEQLGDPWPRDKGLGYLADHCMPIPSTVPCMCNRGQVQTRRGLWSGTHLLPKRTSLVQSRVERTRVNSQRSRVEENVEKWRRMR